MDDTLANLEMGRKHGRRAACKKNRLAQINYVYQRPEPTSQFVLALSACRIRFEKIHGALQYITRERATEKRSASLHDRRFEAGSGPYAATGEYLK